MAQEIRWHDHPNWPRGEFGHPKAVYEMSRAELDAAEQIVRAMR
jgi:hypothetical protein